VTVSTLAAANRMLRSDGLRLGQVLVIPPRGVAYVGPGDTLGGLARRHGVTTAELAKINRLNPEASLRLGQELLLPGYEPAARQASAEKRWGRPKRPGRVTLIRSATRERRTLQLVDARGRATRESSRHVAAQAIDFRIPGVPLEELRAYCERLDHVGVGYYPNSGFVHLDVRRTDARWTDLAGRGEAARVVRKPKPGEAANDALDEESVAEGADEPIAADDGQEPIDDVEPVAGDAPDS
jgi:uncharacterized protein YcbK (DUF882 family)